MWCWVVRPAQDVRLREERLERVGDGQGATDGLAGSSTWQDREIPPATRLVRGRSAAWCGDVVCGDPPGAPRDSLRRQASAAAALASAFGVAAAHAAVAPMAPCASLGPPLQSTRPIFLPPSSPPRQPTGAPSTALGKEHPLGVPGAHRAMGGLTRPVRTASLGQERAAAAREVATSRGTGQTGAGEAGAARGAVSPGVVSAADGPALRATPQESRAQGGWAHGGVPQDTAGAAALSSCAAGALASHGASRGAAVLDSPSGCSAPPPLPGPSEPPVVSVRGPVHSRACLAAPCGGIAFSATC